MAIPPAGLPTKEPVPSGSNQFAVLTHDMPQTQTVWGSQMSVPVSLTASITTGSSYFKIVHLNVCDVTWTNVVEDPNAGELPAGHPPVPVSILVVPSLTPVGSSDGINPLAVKVDQWVGLDVSVDVPQNASLPPGPFTGTAIIKGGAFSHQVDLQCTYLAVGLGSPIGQKWKALGGETKLGAVKDLPHTAPDGKGTIQTFTNGVLYELPVVAGGSTAPAVYFLSTSVYAKWTALAQVTDATGALVWNVLGNPVEDTFTTVEGGQALRFQGGAIVVRKNAQAWAVYGGIYQHYEQFGNLSDRANQPWIGLPISDEQPVDPLDPGGGQRVSHFDGGDIYWSHATGACEMHGPILQHWTTAGGFRPGVGLPTTDQTTAPDGVGYFNRFQGGGAIYWSTATGARLLTGPILDRWNALGGINSYLGYPTSDIAPWASPPPGKSGDICSFQFGQIAVTTDGTITEIPTAITLQASGSAGADLGNINYSVTFMIKSNGDYAVSFHVEDHAQLGYDFQLSAALKAPGGIWLGATHSGSVAGNAITATGSTTNDHTESSTDPGEGPHPWVRGHWLQLQQGVTLSVSLTGSSNGILSFFASEAKMLIEAAAVAAVAGPYAGAMSLLGGQATNSNLGISGTIGVIAGTAVFIVTGGVVLLAVAAGVAAGAVAAANIKERQISAAEYEFANNVFRGTLPQMNQIWLTNLSGLGGRAFTAPGLDGRIYMNLGDGFESPLTFIGNYSRAGEIFIHEMTHVWQIEHASFLPGLICDGMVS